MSDEQLIESLRANAALHGAGTITAAQALLNEAADRLERLTQFSNDGSRRRLLKALNLWETRFVGFKDAESGRVLGDEITAINGIPILASDIMDLLTRPESTNG